MDTIRIILRIIIPSRQPQITYPADEVASHRINGTLWSEQGRALSSRFLHLEELDTRSVPDAY